MQHTPSNTEHRQWTEVNRLFLNGKFSSLVQFRVVLCLPPPTAAWQIIVAPVHAGFASTFGNVTVWNFILLSIDLSY